MKLGISVQNGKKKHNYFCESEKQQPFVWTDYAIIIVNLLFDLEQAMSS